METAQDAQAAAAFRHSLQRKKKGNETMGDSTTSMFYAFAIFIGLYLIGVIIYEAYKLIRKILGK